MSVVVVGGGVCGLSAARVLTAHGETILLEAGPRLGGKIGTIVEDGWMVETGAVSLRLADLALIQALGIRDEVVTISPEARKRYLVYKGRLVPMPSGPISFLTCPLLTLSAKWLLLREMRLRAGASNAEETIAAFITRRFGRQVLERLADPFVSGVFAGDPAYLSVQAAFPLLPQLEAEYGSVLKGFIQRAKTHPAPQIISFKKGMATLVKALSSDLTKAHTNTSVKTICQTDKGWRLETEKETYQAEQVLLTLPAPQLLQLDLPEDLRTMLQPLARICYAPAQVVALGFRREDVTHPLDGFGFLAPSIEGRQVLGAQFVSSIFPGRAPAGHILISAFVGGMRQKTEPVDLIKTTLADLTPLLGLRAAPVYAKVVTWKQAIPQFGLGHGEVKAAVLEAERRFPGLFFAGNYINSVSVPGAIAHAQEVTARMLRPA